MGRRTLLWCTLLAITGVAACTRTEPASRPSPSSPVPSSPPAPTGSTVTPTPSPRIPGHFVSRIGHLEFRYPKDLRWKTMQHSVAWSEQQVVNLHSRKRQMNIGVYITANSPYPSIPPPSRCDGDLIPPEPRTGGSPHRCWYRDLGNRLWVEVEYENDDPEVSLGFMTEAGAFQYSLWFHARTRAEISRVTRTLRIDPLKGACKPYDWIDPPPACDDLPDDRAMRTPSQGERP